MADKAQKNVQVYEPKMLFLTCEIEGLAPGYLGNAWTEDGIKGFEESGGRKPKVAKSIAQVDYDSRASAARRLLHPARNGATDGFPASGVKKALVRAAINSTALEGTKVRTWLFVLPGEDGLLPIIGPEWQTSVLMARAGGKTPMPAVRPLYAAPWRSVVRIQFDSNSLDSGSVLSLLKIAGLQVGIGAYRPECNGDYGRFDVVPGTVQEDAK